MRRRRRRSSPAHPDRRDGSAARRSTSADFTPGAIFVAPHFSLAAAISLALPLFLVTMASQNLPGLAVLAGL